MIELSSGGYQALIDPRRGGSCIRLSRFGVDVLRTPENDASHQAQPFFFGTPLLFFPNRISGGQFEFEGRIYTLPINEPGTGCFLHGTLHETPFEVTAQDPGSVTLRYRATREKPYLTFPHAFTLEHAWFLSADGLRQQVTVTNDSDLNMPLALGFHTTFRLPFSSQGRAQDVTMCLDADQEYSRDPETHLPDGGSTADFPDRQSMMEGSFYPASCSISRLFKMGGRKETALTDPAAGVRLIYTAVRGYDYWMVYNGVSPDFLCVEPQSWLTNCPNAPFSRQETGFDFLAPGEKRIYETRMVISRL